MTKGVVAKIVENGIVAAIYFILTIVTAGFSFGPIQLRISEFLIILAFFRPDFSFGIILGTLLSNITSPVPFDFAFGTAATAISLFLIVYASPRMILAAIYPIVINGLSIGSALYFLFNEGSLPWIATVGYVAAGEAIVMAASYLLVLLLSKNKSFMNFLCPTKHASVRW